mgnify:CR=1 FL=1
MPHRRLNGAQVVVEHLVRQGVGVAAGIPGHGCWTLTDALLDRSDEIRMVQVMHEQSAVHLADGYYRASGQPIRPAAHSIRLYTERETEHLDLECRGFLMFLEQMGILTAASRELVIDRVMALDAGDMDIEQLKWIVLMVLFNEPGQEAAYAWMEDLVFEQIAGNVH